MSRNQLWFGVLVITATATLAAAANDRSALWSVVQACVLDHELTGGPFPCLQVNVAEGVDRGFVVLRPPLGDKDLILAPTRKIIGIEESSVKAAEAPNYFENAWNARSVLTADSGRLPERDEVALAINSRLTRAQDQLHIHIGCLSSEVKAAIAEIAPDLSSSHWRRLTRPIRGIRFWARGIDQETLAGVNPFRLASDGLPDARDDLANVTIVVAGTRSSAASGGFVILAAVNNSSRSALARSGSDVLEHSCY